MLWAGSLIELKAYSITKSNCSDSYKSTGILSSEFNMLNLATPSNSIFFRLLTNILR